MDTLQAAALPTGANRAITPQTSQEPTGISSDFETFLRMLTTQLQNQNPLEPIEASDFAVQLATFSGVEQQVRTNELLSRLTTRMGLAELGAWVGRDALTSAPQQVGSAPVQLVLPEVIGADRAELVLRTRDGAEVSRYAVDPTVKEFLFDPPPASEGGPLPGYYDIEMESFRAGTLLSADRVLGYAQIMEARREGDQVMLVLNGGHLVDATQVAGLRG